jgi:hypothetical protein
MAKHVLTKEEVNESSIFEHAAVGKKATAVWPVQQAVRTMGDVIICHHFLILSDQIALLCLAFGAR